jgi:hypothetical protein
MKEMHFGTLGGYLIFSLEKKLKNMAKMTYLIHLKRIQIVLEMRSVMMIMRLWKRLKINSGWR